MKKPIISASLTNGFLYYRKSNLPIESRLVVHSFDSLRMHKNIGKHSKTIIKVKGTKQIFGIVNMQSEDPNPEVILDSDVSPGMRLKATTLSDGSVFYFQKTPQYFDDKLILEREYQGDCLISKRNEPQIISRGIERFLWLSDIEERDIFSVKAEILHSLGLDRVYSQSELFCLNDAERFNLLFYAALRSTPKKTRHKKGPNRFYSIPIIQLG